MLWFTSSLLRLRGGLEFWFGFGGCEIEDGGEPVSGVGARVGGNLFGCPGGNDLTAAAAAFGAHVDDPVGGFDDVEVVLDDEEGTATFDEFAEGCEELGYIVEVEAGGGLVEDVEGAAAGFSGGVVRAACGDASCGGKVGGELDALGLAA